MGRELLPLLHTENQSIAALWAKICLDAEARETEWIRQLRFAGIKAAHPNDGWVNRDAKEVTFTYPQFNDGADVGDLVALGWPSDKPGQTRIVRLTAKRETLFSMIYWRFEDN